MAQAKHASKRKRRSKAIPALGAAGLLSLASSASAQTVGLSHAADMPARNPDPGHQITLSEEEVCDVSLATFYVFDKENTALVSPSVQLVRGGCGGCGGGGCRGCGGRGCGCFGGCGGCAAWWLYGGCSGCYYGGCYYAGCNYGGCNYGGCNYGGCNSGAPPPVPPVTK